MGRDMERITVTLRPKQKERLDELVDDSDEFSSRSAVIRHIIDEYDSGMTDGVGDREDSHRSTSVSFQVPFDPRQRALDHATPLQRLKWWVGDGVPDSALADAFREVQTIVTEAGLGEGVVDIESQFVDVEELEENEREDDRA